MIHYTRTIAIAPGKTIEAFAFAREITEFLQKKYDRKMQLAVPVGGNPQRISWRDTYPGLAALEEFQARVMQDAEYLALLTRAGPLFVAGSANDEIWRAI